MSKRHRWTEEEEEIVRLGIANGEQPRAIADKLPHISYASAKNKCDKLRQQKRVKTEQSSPGNTQALIPVPNRGTFLY
jgi:hypothetical protein